MQQTPNRIQEKYILITGANGYIGSRLVLALAKKGQPVKAMVRDPLWISRYQVKYPNIEVIVGDIRDKNSLKTALSHCSTAFYLVHALSANTDLIQEETECARLFATTAVECGVDRLIYLGGLANEHDPELSIHLRSRIEVGKVLRAHHPLVLECRASVILGTGSISFELIKALVHRLPIMITPKWVNQFAQPIYVEDVIHYLLIAIQFKTSTSQVLEIGGQDQVSYRDLILEYARQKGLTRHLISVPVLTPRLSSLWLGLVTPIYARIGKKLIEGLQNPSIVTTPNPEFIHTIKTKSYREAIQLIIEGKDILEGAWWFQSSAGHITPSHEKPTHIAPTYSLTVQRKSKLESTTLFQKILQIGGKNGYFWGNWLWILRGWIDLLMGGVGHSRTQSKPNNTLQVGDVLDWWRVVELVPNRSITLKAEMKLPGTAFLTLAIKEESDHRVIQLNAQFQTEKWYGRLYWIILWPIHAVMFKKMLEKLDQKE